MRTIKELVVHCSATPAGKAFHVADIDRWHREKGWDSCGYHFVICLDGSIEPGRPIEEAGAHVQGHNANTIGICLIGGVGPGGKAANTFNDRQFDALELVLHGLRAKFKTAEILGHRDFPDVHKDCPSFDVRAWCKSRGIAP
jgi:N-acetylmuramoyl-L-alanine amidase